LSQGSGFWFPLVSGNRLFVTHTHVRIEPIDRGFRKPPETQKPARAVAGRPILFFKHFQPFGVASVKLRYRTFSRLQWCFPLKQRAKVSVRATALQNIL
jgi:hypothetical protein